MKYPSSYADGNQLPTNSVVPKYKSNDIFDCIDLMRGVGIELMDWQQVLLEGWLGYDKHGKWSARSCGNQVPRQNGKTLAIQARALVEMLFYGGTVLYTSQLQKTSTETFDEMCNMFQTKALRKYLAQNGIRSALGREEIRLKSGARIKFLARTRNGGDGQHGSLLIFDEAQCLDQQAQESFLPAISATQAKRGSQTIYNGTPPKDGDYGLVFESLRNRALEGKTKSVAWTEWSAGYGGKCPDVEDRELWKRTNPSYGVLISEETIEGEVEQTHDREKLAHQRLGWWTGVRTAQTLIATEEWRELEADSPDEWDKLAYGIKFSSDGALAALSVAIKTGEKSHVEFIRQRPVASGIQWLVSWLNERKDECALIAIDGKSGADDLRLRLIEVGVNPKAIQIANTEYAINAAAMLVNNVADKNLTHSRDKVFMDAATKSIKRKIGNAGGFSFAGENSEIIESAALALYAVRTTKRDPKRKAQVW